MCSGRVKNNLLDKTVEYPAFKASFKFDKKLNFLFFLKESVLLYEYISTGIYSNFENFQPVIREITLLKNVKPNRERAEGLLQNVSI
jgi:hypothetical protein